MRDHECPSGPACDLLSGRQPGRIGGRIGASRSARAEYGRTSYKPVSLRMLLLQIRDNFPQTQSAGAGIGSSLTGSDTGATSLTGLRRKYAAIAEIRQTRAPTRNVL